MALMALPSPFMAGGEESVGGWLGGEAAAAKVSSSLSLPPRGREAPLRVRGVRPCESECAARCGRRYTPSH